MKKYLRGAAALIAGPVLFYAVRVGALWLLGALFRAWNLNAETYAYAPAWARQVADLSGEIVETTALTAVCAALIALLPRGKRANWRGVLRCLVDGTALGGVLLFLLMVFGSIRAPREMIQETAPVLLRLGRETVLWLAAALWLRGALVGLCRGAGRWPAGIVSAAGEAALLCLLLGVWHWTLILCGVLAGALFFLLYERSGSIYYEAALCLGVRIAERVIFEYPDLGRAWPVSEPWLTGEFAGGLLGSGAMLICLLILTGSLTCKILLRER